MAAASFAETIEQGLNTRRVGRDLRHLDRCGSTSDEAARWGEGGAPDGAVVVADEQSAGRGRLGRVWHSPAAANLYVSILLRPQLPVAALPPLTLLTGAAVAQALTSFSLKPQLKWPNDIMLPTAAGLRKAGGILIEMATAQSRIRHVVVGIGINISARPFPPELVDVATSIGNVRTPAPDRAAVLCAVLNSFEAAYDRFATEGAGFALTSWRRFGWLGQRCRVEREGVVLEGTAADVDDTGALVLEDAAGKRHVVLSGEVVTKL